MSRVATSLYRWVFAVAGVYNVVFGIWCVLAPTGFFHLFDLQIPAYPSIWSCLGMVVGLYGLAYLYAAWKIDRARPFIAIGLLGKILGPIGWVIATHNGALPTATFPLIVFDDLIWLVPFSLFLLEPRRVVTAIRSAAPYACATCQFVALIAMGIILRPGMPIIGNPSQQIAYVTDHHTLWFFSWILWMIAGLSLLSFYAWWGGRLSLRVAVIALSIAAIGYIFDITGESWLASNAPSIAATAWPYLLSGFFANGLYTVAGIFLTVTYRSRLSPLLLWWAGIMWTCGILVSASALLALNPVIAVSTAVLFVLFIPWIILMARTT